MIDSKRKPEIRGHAIGDVGPARTGIARATLGAAHGKLAQTGAEAHYSLWLRQRFHVEAHRLLQVVA